MKPFEAKLKKVAKEPAEVSGEVARLIDLAKRPEMKDLSGDFMEEANSLGKRKSELQVERQKLQMEIDYRRNLVTDEKIICEKLTDFIGLFEELEFEEQSELLGLILKEIEVSRFDPEKDDHPCDKEAFVTQMRTSWYRVDLKLFSNSLSIREMLGKSRRVSGVRNSGKSGGPGGIRTLDTLLEYTPLAGERFQPLSHRSWGCQMTGGFLRAGRSLSTKREGFSEGAL